MRKELYKELCSVACTDVKKKQEIVDEIIQSDEAISEIYENIIHHTKAIMISYSPYFNIEYDEVGVLVTTELLNTNFKEFLTKDIDFKRNLAILILRACQMYLAEKYGLTKSEYEKARHIEKVCKKYNIEIDEANAYKIAKLSGYTIKVTIASIRIYRSAICSTSFEQFKEMKDFQSDI